MTEEEKRIVKKLKAIINNTPYDGEKNTALNVLKKYCLKHNISESDLDDNEKRYFEYVVNGKSCYEKYDENASLFEVVARKFYERRNEDFYEQGHRGGEFGGKYHYQLYMTYEDFISLISEYEFYKNAFKKAKKKSFTEWERNFFRAFLMKQKLLLKPTDEDDMSIPTPDEIRREEQVMAMASGIKKANYYKQIGNKQGGNGEQ